MRLFLMPCFCFAVGCSTAPDDSDLLRDGEAPALGCGAGAAAVALGTGEHSFEAIPQHGGVPIIVGFQGGYHVWISVRTRGLGPVAQARFGVVDADTGATLSAPRLEAIITMESGPEGDEYCGIPALLDTQDGERLLGRRVRLQISIKDACHDDVHAEALTALTSLVEQQ